MHAAISRSQRQEILLHHQTNEGNKLRGVSWGEIGVGLGILRTMVLPFQWVLIYRKTLFVWFIAGNIRWNDSWITADHLTSHLNSREKVFVSEWQNKRWRKQLNSCPIQHARPDHWVLTAKRPHSFIQKSAKASCVVRTPFSAVLCCWSGGAVKLCVMSPFVTSCSFLLLLLPVQFVSWSLWISFMLMFKIK